MFARRHPYLFFILLMTVISCSTSIVLSLVAGRGPADVEGESIGVVELVGVIADSRTVLADLKRFREDDDVKAIVLRIDSPGGGVGPSQEIYRALLKTRKVKPVIASLGSVAASGGYYAAAATSGIMTNPGTVTGSIGVIMGYTNFRSIIDKLGLKPVVIKSGANKDMGSPVKELTPEQRAIFQGVVDQLHEQFVTHIAEGRGMEKATVAKLADGRIYPGEEAIRLGLCDREGNLEDALSWAAEKAGIEGDGWHAVYPPENKPFVRQLIEGVSDAVVKAMNRGIDMEFGYLLRPQLG